MNDAGNLRDDMRHPLYTVRVRQDLTQQRLAAEARISRRYLITLENNRKQPGVVIAIKLARALNATVEELFGHLVGEERAAPAGKP